MTGLVVDADLVDDPVLVVTTGGKVVAGNRSAHDLLGSLDGADIAALMAEEPDAVCRELERLTASTEPVPARLTPVLPGTDRLVLDVVGRRRDSDGDDVLLNVRTVSPVAIEAADDLAARELARRQGVEERLHRLLSSTMTELEETHHRLRECGAALAHDLRNPLTSVHALAELVGETEELSPQGQDFINRIVAASAACERLIRDTLVEHLRGVTAQVVDVDLLEEVRWLRSMVGDPALDLRSNPSLPVVRAGRNALRQVLLNLVVNALKHRGEQSRVRVDITATPLEQGWRVTVSDDGPGIPVVLREAALRPGERLGSLTEGTGLGLANSRATVERAGGRLWLDDSPLGGLSAHVDLPRAPRRS